MPLKERTMFNTKQQTFIEQIRKNSPILKELEDNGQIKIVGGIYDMNICVVIFSNNK